MITFGCLDERGEIMDGWTDGRMDGCRGAVPVNWRRCIRFER